MRNKIIRNRTKVKRSDPGFAGYIAALHRAVHALGLYFDAALHGELSQAEAIVLLHLAGEGTSTINDVHRAFLHKRSTLTSVVDRLESKGLVQRRIGQTDRRNFSLELSAQGKKAADRVVEAVRDLERIAEISSAQLHALVSALEKTANAARDAGA